MYMDDLKLYGKNENQVDTLIQSVRVVSTDMPIEFGISKCESLVMKRGKLVHTDGITTMVNIRSLSEINERYNEGVR